MHKVKLAPLGVVSGLILVTAALLSALAVAPANQYFKRTWAWTDQPVQEGEVSRTWMWGPEANTEAMMEPYIESPGGEREVQYYDKSRMELTHPDTGDPDSIWYVTNGLLVVELITGKLQLGDNQFEQHQPAQVNVAGDADDTSGPTYDALASRLDDPATPVASLITGRISRAGAVTDDSGLAAQGVSVAVVDDVTNHGIAEPFWAFMNTTGTVWDGSNYVEAKLFENAYFATGRPVTEAYWAEVKVAGTVQLVLLQCFERRCLTFTPLNDPVWQVEAGNVGQHYYRWRYEQIPDEGTGPPTATTTPTATSTQTATPSSTGTATSTATPTESPATEYEFVSQWNRWLHPASDPLDLPTHMDVDEDGNLYVIDSGNHQVQAFDAEGNFITKWGSYGSAPGQFNSPGGIVALVNEVFVIDTNNHRIQVFDKVGNFISEWGGFGSANGQFKYPRGADFTSGGGLYVVDSGNARVQIFSLSGGYIAGFSQGRFIAPNLSRGPLQNPIDIALYGGGLVYVLEGASASGPARVQMYAAGSGYDYAFIKSWGSAGVADGQFSGPTAISVDIGGQVYVVDHLNHRIQQFSSDGVFIRKWGSSGTQPGQFILPYDYVPVSTDMGYVSETGNSRVQSTTPSGDGFDMWSQGWAEFSTPWDVEYAEGRIYVADPDGDRIAIFDPDGNPIAMWDRLSAGTSPVTGPTHLEVTQDGSVLVVDFDNHRIVKYSETGDYLTSWGSFGANTSQFNGPNGVATDSAGNVYVADTGNNRIQKFGNDGTLLTAWGQLGDGDGEFNRPTGIAIFQDTVYVVESNNYRVQAFSLNGDYLRKWGRQGSGQGEFGNPYAVAADSDGFIFVTDLNDRRVQKFTLDGTYLGQWGSAGSGPGEFTSPLGIAVDDDGNVYVSDFESRLQKFRPVN